MFTRKSIIFCALFTMIGGLYAEDYDNSRSFQLQVVTALKNSETRLNTVIERVNNLQDNYMILMQNVNSLKNTLSIEQQKNAELRSQMETLKKQITSDRTNMQQTLNTAVDKIARETSAAVSKAASTASKASAIQSNNGKPPYGTGKFVEYKVQSGATLHTIAKAYKTSVSSIKKANGLKSDMLSEGQLLYIPQNSNN